MLVIRKPFAIDEPEIEAFLNRFDVEINRDSLGLFLAQESQDFRQLVFNDQSELIALFWLKKQAGEVALRVIDETQMSTETREDLKMAFGRSLSADQVNQLVDSTA